MPEQHFFAKAPERRATLVGSPDSRALLRVEISLPRTGGRGKESYALFHVPSQHTMIRLALNHCPVGLLWAQGTILGSILGSMSVSELKNWEARVAGAAEVSVGFCAHLGGRSWPGLSK